MELFTLLVNPKTLDAERLTNEIRGMLDRLHQGSGGIELRRVPLDGGTGIVCDIAPADEPYVTHARKLASRAVAQEVMSAYEDKLLDRCIQKELGADVQEDAASVKIYCNQMLTRRTDAGSEHEKDAFFDRRLAKLADLIEDYLTDQPFLHIEGFLRFRAKPYLNELRETAAYAVDEWMMERQYQEFISLLRYFVYIQEAKTPAAHVVHLGNHDFKLLDATLAPIDTKQMDQFVVELIDQDINYEDVIVSTLISISPGKLYVHSPYPEQQIIKTILTIFEGRAELCSDCHICLPVEKQNKNP